MAKLENRYIVFKLKDVNKYLDSEDRYELNFLIEKLSYRKHLDNKPPTFQAVVVESDWPMYDETVRLVLEEADRRGQEI